MFQGWVKEKNDLDYEAASDVNSNLVELLKTKSAKFAELIAQQVNFLPECFISMFFLDDCVISFFQ